LYSTSVSQVKTNGIVLLNGEGSGMNSKKRVNAVDTVVGARIRNLRLRNRLSQSQLGKQLGVTFQQVQKYENGTNRVSAGRLAGLAKLFSVPIAALYGEQKTGRRPQLRARKIETRRGSWRHFKL
jgi:DNA-binding XRE family transcriptional regulator